VHRQLERLRLVGGCIPAELRLVPDPGVPHQPPAAWRDRQSRPAAAARAAKRAAGHLPAVDLEKSRQACAVERRQSGAVGAGSQRRHIARHGAGGGHGEIRKRKNLDAAIGNHDGQRVGGDGAGQRRARDGGRCDRAIAVEAVEFDAVGEPEHQALPAAARKGDPGGRGRERDPIHEVPRTAGRVDDRTDLPSILPGRTALVGPAGQREGRPPPSLLQFELRFVMVGELLRRPRLLASPRRLAAGDLFGPAGPESEQRDAGRGGGQRQQRDGRRRHRRPVPASDPHHRLPERFRRRQHLVAVEIPPQIGGERGRIGVAERRLLLQTLEDHPRKWPLDRRRERAGLRFRDHAGRLGEPRARHVVRAAARDEFVEHQSERIDVGPRIEVAPRLVKLLGAHVLRRARVAVQAGVVGTRLRVVLPRRHHGDAEVDQLHDPAGFDEDVARLDVAVNQSLTMGVGGRLADAHEQFHPLSHGQVVGGGVGRDRACIRNQLHHQEGEPAGRARGDPGGVEVGDARVPQARERLRLVFEPLHGIGRHARAAKHLHGDEPLRPSLPRLVDAAHPAATDQPLDPAIAHERSYSEIRKRRRGGAAKSETRRPPRQVGARAASIVGWMRSIVA